jgi:hypothetical protein
MSYLVAVELFKYLIISKTLVSVGHHHIPLMAVGVSVFIFLFLHRSHS